MIIKATAATFWVDLEGQPFFNCYTTNERIYAEWTDTKFDESRPIFFRNANPFILNLTYSFVGNFPKMERMILLQITSFYPFKIIIYKDGSNEFTDVVCTNIRQTKENLTQKVTKIVSFPNIYALSSVYISGSAKNLFFIQRIDYSHLHLSNWVLRLSLKIISTFIKSIDLSIGSD